MASKITKRRVDAVKPGETVWDGHIPGFGLRAFKGGAKTYVLKFRTGGTQRWLTIGRHGAPWTPETARKEALRHLASIADGGDPAADKSDARDAESFSDFAKRYIVDFSLIHKKSSTATEEQRHLKNHILPAIGRKRVRDITHADIAKLHRSLKDIPYSANRCLAILSHMFSVAVDWGVRPDGPNPCARVKRFPEKARERFLSPDELKRLGTALAEAESSGESIYSIAAIRLLLFTGGRLNEILTLQWSHIDFEARLLRLPDSKTGEKTVALPAPAAETLSSLDQQKGNPFVICGRKAGSHLVNLQKPWRRVRSRADLDDVRIHDLRHSFASVAAAGGMSLPLIGSLLGHTQAQTTQRYAHLADDPRIVAADAVANEIAASINPRQGEVISLKKGKA